MRMCCSSGSCTFAVLLYPSLTVTAPTLFGLSHVGVPHNTRRFLVCPCFCSNSPRDPEAGLDELSGQAESRDPSYPSSKQLSAGQRAESGLLNTADLPHPYPTHPHSLLGLDLVMERISPFVDTVLYIAVLPRPARKPNRLQVGFKCSSHKLRPSISTTFVRPT